MAITQLHSLEFDTVNGTHSSICKIDDTHFMVAYSGESNNGFIKTCSINGSYEVAVIDTLEFDTSDASYTSLAKLDSTHLVVAYAGASSDAFVAVISFDANCDNLALVHYLEHDTSNCTYPAIYAIDSAHIVIAYGGVDDDGFIKTFSTGISSAVNNSSTLVVSEGTSEFVGLAVKGSASRTLTVAEATAAFVPFSTTVSNMSNKKFGLKDRYEPFRISKRVY